MTMNETITFNDVEYKIEDMTTDQRTVLGLVKLAMDQVKVAQFGCEALTNKLGELLENDNLGTDTPEDS